MFKWLLTLRTNTLSLVLIGGSCWAQDERFEVVSIHHHVQQEGSSSTGTSPGGRWYANNLTVLNIIKSAYSVSDHQISGLPAWVNVERFDVQAKGDVDSSVDRRTELVLLKKRLRNMLADRFHLVVEREEKLLPGFELVLGTARKEALSTVPPDTPIAVKEKPGSVSFTGHTMDQFARTLGTRLGKVVVNKTGLSDKHNFSIKLTPEESFNALFGKQRSSVVDSEFSSSSIFSVLPSQLGLRLQPVKVLTEIIKIMRIDKPTEN